MKHNFALTTRQAARLAHVEPHVLYQSHAREGHWRGITPTKLPNGRLLWRGDDVASVSDIIPAHADQTPGERSLVAFLDQVGLPLTADYWNLGRALLSTEVDHASDPDLIADEATFVAEIVMAYCTRLERALPTMEDRSKRRVYAALALIASQAESFEGVAK